MHVLTNTIDYTGHKYLGFLETRSTFPSVTVSTPSTTTCVHKASIQLSVVGPLAVCSYSEQLRQHTIQNILIQINFSKAAVTFKISLFSRQPKEKPILMEKKNPHYN